ncbi:Gfo/Idh/MocA family oxidoreductase [Bacillus cereus]|uniref:Gfo/Idh/MocA family protein n=1 Tax=Bacillus thuringiensis TaxID=1428 RepID=UPI0004512AA9|nr:Gfo/Idh/MocA family oxidoreductase [Bacillus thuringiensis]MDA2113206.1 Gfo/Idh/MocA family oxidoreductase [Bacillus cereus]QUW68475.1 Gfo/Idh/MocA family oxidoreductase [Pseudomonas synxantha]EXY04987.1 dehydrogenase [Bacillus thuringiensis]MDA2130361.1 Gfo/Idh/MocA family oxidoreductase [Bacillus cereus]MDA2152743.1 Gfo/Idh/MocA family oxidoreductase [Bacillus cereus]
MNILKVGIIGCGSIAQHRHLPEYEANPYVQIVAVCDSNKKRAKEIANKYGVNMYTDYNELINYEELDAVSVCTPNHLHAAISIAALQAGIHVLCEKPIATSKADAEMMIGAAEKSGKKLMIGHNQRFVASHQKAKQLIKSGAIGKIYSFRTAFGHSGPENWSVDGKESWFFKKEEAFLGAMGDLGVHKADLIRYILNEEITEVGAFVETSAKTFSNVDDCAVCILKSESGIIGTLAASWSYVSKEDNSTIIYGEKATLRLEDDPTNSLIIQYKNGEVVKYELNKIQSNATVGQSNSHVIEQFVDSVLSNKEPLINGVEGMKSLEVILAAIQSSETKQVVTIPL